MPTTTRVNDLKINRLTKAQYDAAVQAGTIGEYELSILTDVDESIQKVEMPTASAEYEGKIYQYTGATTSTYKNGYFYKCVSEGDPTVYSWEAIEVQDTPELNYIPQLDSLPEASASNVDDIVQYSGVTIPAAEAIATGTQTVGGSSLGDITVDTETFVATEQPTEAETVEFTCIQVASEDLATKTGGQAGLSVTITNVDTFLDKLKDRLEYQEGWAVVYIVSLEICAYRMQGGTPHLALQIRYRQNPADTPGATWVNLFSNEWAEFALSVTGELDVYDMNVEMIPMQDVIVTPASWTKDSTEVNLEDYGISFTGTAVVDDEITVTYTPAVKNIINGYFYQSTPIYDTPDATISQTVGYRAPTAEFDRVSGDVDMSASGTTVADYVALKWGEGESTIGFQIRFIYNTDQNQIHSQNLRTGLGIWTTQSELESLGFIFSGTFGEGCEVTCDYTPMSGLAKLELDIDSFVEAERPTTDETVDFVASVTRNFSHLSGAAYGLSMDITNPGLFEAKCCEYLETLDIYDLPTQYNVRACRTSSGGPYQFEIGIYAAYSWHTLSSIDIANASTYGLATAGALEVYDSWETIIDNIQVTSIASWIKNSEVVDLANYGITYDINYSTPIKNGDTIEVDYTAPAILGYEWKQKDVQSGSGGSAGGEINWYTIADLPGDYLPSDWNVYPFIKIPGGLPDGKYEFYYQTKLVPVTQDDTVFGLITTKANIEIDNENHTASGYCALVLDGKNTIGNFNRKMPADGVQQWGGGRTYQGDLYFIFSSLFSFSTDIHGNYTGIDVPECFKITKIKNIETGKEYKPELILSYDGYNWDAYWNGYISMPALQQSPDIPRYWSENNFFAANAKYSILRPFRDTLTYWDGASEATLCATQGNNKFHMHFMAYNNEYLLEIPEVSGIFENTKVCKINNQLAVVWNLPQDVVGTIDFTYNVKGSNTSDNYLNIYQEEPSSYIELNPLKVGITPTAPQYLGKIQQYTGETNNTYTSGYFYKVTGTRIDIPASVECYNVDPSTATVSMNIDQFISLVTQYTGWGKSYINEMINNGAGYSITWDNSQFWWSPYGTWFGDQAAALIQCVTISERPENVGINWTTRNYSPAHSEIQNGAWEQVNVQEGSIVSVMPAVTDVENGKIVQYAGTTDVNYTNGYFYKNNTIVTPTSISISQTVGSSLSDLTVDLATFEAEEQPSGNETVDFVADVQTDPNSILIIPVQGDFGIQVSEQDFKTLFDATAVGWHDEYSTGRLQFFYGFEGLGIYFQDNNGNNILNIFAHTLIDNFNFNITGDPQSGDYATYDVNESGIIITWEKDSTEINPSDYGITYTGTPEDGDTLEVVYTAQVITGGWDRIDVQPAVDPLPSQTGNNGKFLTTNGTSASWATVDALPSQAGNSGKVLTTNGTSAYWTNMTTTPATTPTLLGGSTYWQTDAQTGVISQTINVTGVTANNIVMVGPSPISSDDYAEAGVLCVNQGVGTLTFTCKTIPSVDLTLNVICF